MPKDVKTNVIIEHETKGFDKVRQTNEKYNSSLAKIKGNLNALRKEYRDTNKELQSLMKTFDQQNKLAEKQQRKAAKQGAFTQGLVQGGFPIPAMMLQRGPGMGRQMAGMAVGRMAGASLGMGKAGLGGSFTGVQGLQQFLGSIPLVGGLLAGQVGRMSGYAEKNIGYQRTRLGASPYTHSFKDIQGENLLNRISAQRRGLEKTDLEKKKTTDVADLASAAVITRKKIRKEEVEKAVANVSKETDTNLFESIINYVTGKDALKKIAAVKVGLEKSKARVSEAERVSSEMYNKLQFDYQDDVAGKAGKLARLKRLESATKKSVGMPDIAGAGLELMGVNKEEATQLFSAFLQEGGGFGSGSQAKEMMRPAFAARTRFGIQAPTSGAFLKGARRGGLVGGLDQGATVFKGAIAEGLALGLSGSEINNWMQQIAQGINQFGQTGIPINPGSISRLAADIGKSGIDGTRAVAMAQGITQHIQGIGSQGISSGADIMMLRKLGGYKGGGAAGFREARAKLEELKFDAQGKGVKGITGGSKLGKALKSYMVSVGGDQATKAEMLQRLLQRWGVKGGVREFDWLANSLMGGEIGGEQAAGISRFSDTQAAGLSELKSMSKTGVGGLEAAARKQVSIIAPNAKRMSGIQNQQIALGGKVAKTMQDLEQNALNVTKGFHALSGDALPELANMMGELSMKAIELAGKFKELVDEADIFKNLKEDISYIAREIGN